MEHILDDLLNQKEDSSGVKAMLSGIQTRVVHRDGVDYIVTMDMNPNRINPRIENGIITDAYTG
jgi:hypothetical protein